MFERIVVIVDGSATSQYAIGASITVAREVGGRLTFCLTIDPDLNADGVGMTAFAELAYELKARLLEDALARARRSGVDAASGCILTEEPVHGLVAAARNTGADLIMMGLAPRIGILRPFMRSLAEEVLRETTIPLCVMRRPARGRLSRRILVPIVDDALAHLAIEHAIAIACAFRSTLVFCSIETNARDAGLRSALDAAQAAARARGVAAEELLLPKVKDISSTIVRNAGILECDSIVMASHVRQGWPRLIEGSVAEAVIYASDVPVIIVRGPRQ